MGSLICVSYVYITESMKTVGKVSEVFFCDFTRNYEVLCQVSFELYWFV
jgi:hypothetical protein